MMIRWLVVLAQGVLCGCAVRPPPPPVVVPAIVVTPVRVTTTYIAAHVPHFARGEYAIVEICIAADGGIDTMRVTLSSADKAFDEAAMAWARQASYRPQLENGRAVYGCQEVRVEINRNPGTRGPGGADSALG